MGAGCNVTLSQWPQTPRKLRACPAGSLAAGSSPQGQFGHSPTGLFGEEMPTISWHRPCWHGSTTAALPAEEIREWRVENTAQLSPGAPGAALPTLLPPWHWVCPSQSGRLFYFYGNISPETLQREPGAVR